MNYFSTRELSLLIWIGIFIIWKLFSNSGRGNIGGVFRSLIRKKVALVLLTLIAFTLVAGVLLAKTAYWEPGLIKDLSFWFFGFVMGTLFTLNDASKRSYFKNIISGIFKFTILTEFLLIFYTFSLAAELLLLPVLVFLSVTKDFSERDKKYREVTSVLSNTLAFIGLSYFGYALYKTIAAYRDLFTVFNLIELILPCLLSVAILPVFYLIAVYMEYGELFTRTDQMTRHMGAEKKARKAVFLAAGLSLRRITLINKKMIKSDIHHSENLIRYFKSLTKTRRQPQGNKSL